MNKPVDEKWMPDRNADNIYVRFYKNSCFMGLSRNFGIGVMRPMAYWHKKPHRDELYIIQNKDSDGVLMIGGTSGVRMDIKEIFKVQFGSEKPTFA